MSMDLCFQDGTNCVQSVINLSNRNHGTFNRFIGSCLKDYLVQQEEIVDSINLDPTGDADYDDWKERNADIERNELVVAQARYEAWTSDTMNLCDMLVAMGVCLGNPNHPQYLGYISTIIAEGSQALAIGNPSVYWA